MKTNPYRTLPDHCFWRRAVADVAPQALDPLVEAPFQIAQTDKVATAGSCFAQHISRYLRDAGFHFLVTEPAHPLLDKDEAALYNYGTYTARYGNLYTVRQLLQLYQRAYGLFQPEEDCWIEGNRYIDPFRPQIQPDGFATLAEFQADRARHLAAVRRTFETLDVFVFTLGLTEAWESSVDGALFPLCPGVAGGEFDPSRHRLRNLGVAEIVADALAFIDLLRSRNPGARIILTVSPVPLVATAMAHEHVLTATTYSKSVLRVACTEIQQQRPLVAYMPSYEMITGNYARGRYFADDCRSVNEAGVAHVMRVFLRHFAGVHTERDAAAVHTVQDDAHVHRMNELVDIICEENTLDHIQKAEGVVSCNLCGGTQLGPGPGGRLGENGRPPRCLQCQSLERNRAVGALFQSLPPDFLAWRRALLIGPDQGVRRDWLRHCDGLILNDRTGLDHPWLSQPGGAYDFIGLIFAFEFLHDDIAAFDTLWPLLSPLGVLQICFIDAQRQEKTVPRTDAGGLRRYGRDLFDYFGCQAKGLKMGLVQTADPCTGKEQWVHLFFGQAAAAQGLPCGGTLVG